MPYKPQQSTINNLKFTVGLNPRAADVIYISEAAKALAKLNIQSARLDIINQLLKADSWCIGLTETAYLAQNLVGSLIELDVDQQDFINEVFTLFNRVVNIQIKAELIYYFVKLKVKDKNNTIISFFDNYKGSFFPPRNHGTYYRREAVTITKEGFLTSIDGLKNEYLNSVQ